MKFLIILLQLLSISSGFFFELPGITQPRQQQQQCCCPPPPSCGGGGYAPPQPYPSSGYVPPYRRKRMTQSGELEASSDDQLCNSIVLRNLMKKALIEDDEKGSRQQIHSHIRNMMSATTDAVVMCSNANFNFTASHDSEYCMVAARSFNCFAFVF